MVTAGEPTLVRGNVQRCGAAEFIRAMHLRDPRVAPNLQFVSSKPQRVIEAILAWDSLPTDDDIFSLTCWRCTLMGPQCCARGGLRYPSRLAGVPSFLQ